MSDTSENATEPDGGTGSGDMWREANKEPRSAEELLAVEFITIDEVRALYPRTKPLPAEHKLDEAECHNCGHPWDGGDDWAERHLHGGPSAGEDWKYRCPNCGFETFECGT